jgi:hypothetical protein
MTADQLRELKNTSPFKPFTINMTDGKSYSVRDPEDLFIHPDWSVDAIVVHPGGLFSFIYLRNVASISGKGPLPKAKRRRGPRSGGGEE